MRSSKANKNGESSMQLELDLNPLSSAGHRLSASQQQGEFDTSRALSVVVESLHFPKVITVEGWL